MLNRHYAQIPAPNVDRSPKRKIGFQLAHVPDPVGQIAGKRSCRHNENASGDGAFDETKSQLVHRAMGRRDVPRLPLCDKRRLFPKRPRCVHRPETRTTLDPFEGKRHLRHPSSALQGRYERLADRYNAVTLPACLPTLREDRKILSSRWPAYRLDRALNIG